MSFFECLTKANAKSKVRCQMNKKYDFFNITLKFTFSLLYKKIQYNPVKIDLIGPTIVQMNKRLDNPRI